MPSAPVQSNYNEGSKNVSQFSVFSLQYKQMSRCLIHHVTLLEVTHHKEKLIQTLVYNETEAIYM